MSGTDNKERLLSITIPTYNRRDSLIKLLKSIESSSYQQLREIVISDNHSDYDIKEELSKEFTQDFLSYCRIIVNPFNIGGPGNIKNLFLLCHSKYMWMIGDDDEVLPDSIDIILRDIEEDSECAQFRYSIVIDAASNELPAKNVIEENKIMCSLNDFMQYYEEKDRHKGNMVYMSNNIFNLEKLKPYIHYAFTYNTSITHLIPFLKGLDERDIYIRYRNLQVVRYVGQPGGTSWNYIRVMGAVSTINQIPFKSLDTIQFKRLKQVLRFVTLRHFLFWCLCHKDNILRVDRVESIYENFYKGNADLKDYIIYLCVMVELKTGIKLIPRSTLSKMAF